jgi:hypothetical protein
MAKKNILYNCNYITVFIDKMNTYAAFTMIKMAACMTADGEELSEPEITVYDNKIRKKL